MLLIYRAFAKIVFQKCRVFLGSPAGSILKHRLRRIKDISLESIFKPLSDLTSFSRPFGFYTFTYVEKTLRVRDWTSQVQAPLPALKIRTGDLSGRYHHHERVLKFW